MCILDLIKLHVTQTHKSSKSRTYERYSKSLADVSEVNYQRLKDVKYSSLYPEFMLVKVPGEELETESTSLQGSVCTDFVFSGGDCENLHGLLGDER